MVFISGMNLERLSVTRRRWQPKPRKRHPSEFKHITSLVGLSLQDRADFAWNDVKRFFKVTLYEKSNICVWCKKPFSTLEEASLDHIVPRSRGGRTRLSNLQLMHGRCNGAKSDKMPTKYSYKAFIPTESNSGTVTKFMNRQSQD